MASTYFLLLDRFKASSASDLSAWRGDIFAANPKGTLLLNHLCVIKRRLKEIKNGVTYYGGKKFGQRVELR